jgi:hypothetical protein
MSQLFVSAAAAGAAIVLHGCGSGDETTTTSSTDPWGPSTGPVTDTTTPAGPTEAPITGLVCTDSEEACVSDLNKLYAGFDETNDASPLGVPIRGRQSFSDGGEWFFCTGQCYDNSGQQPAQPDCYAAAALINHRVMTTEEGQLPNMRNSKSGENAFFARYPVLIVLQPETALTRLTKCAWQFDGAAFNRQNGGCGNGAKANLCKDPESAYNDKCPDDQSRWADESCAFTMEAYCNNASVDYGTNCFWKGPAFRSPVYPGAEPDFDFSDFARDDEVRQMLKNRVSDDHQSGTTLDGLPLREYWNEITMDGRIIKHLEETEGVRSVIAAVAFVRGNGDELDANNQRMAQQYIDHFKNQSVDVPLLVLDTDSAEGTGPFASLSTASMLV